MFTIRSSLTANTWPAVPNAQGAQLLALLAQMESSQWLSRTELRERQLQQLYLVLAHASNSVPFYRERLDSVGWSPQQPLTWEMFQRLPLLKREDVQLAGAALHSSNPPAEHGAAISRFTSGSLGKPVMILLTGLTNLFWQAFTLRDHLWHRRDLRGMLASIRFLEGDTALPPHGTVMPNWGPATQPVAETGPVCLLNIRATVEEQADWLVRRDPTYLLSYPSNVLALARHMARTGLRLPRLRQVRTFGEVLDPKLRSEVRAAWGVPVVDNYSCQELGYLALQAPDGEHYLVQEENVLLEVLREDGSACEAGEIGRVVVTGLHNFAMPLVRYEIGDYAEVGAASACGRGLTVLRRILGRARNMVTLPNGARRWPAIEVSADTRPEDMPPVRQFQIVQKSRNEIEARLAVYRPLSSEEEERLRSWLRRGLGHNGFRITAVYVDDIPRGPGGKYEDFRSELIGMP